MRYLKIILITLLLSSCNNQKKVFENTKINTGEFALYFYTPEYYLTRLNIDTTKIKLVKRFKIDNEKIVKEIINSWKFPVLNAKKSIIPLYILEISRNNKIYANKLINKDLTILMGRYYYKFDKQQLFKYRKFFKPVIAYNVTINKLNHARRFVEILEKDNGYLPYRRKDVPYYWKKYSGSIGLKYTFEKLPQFTSSEEINRFLQKKFSKISKVELQNYYEQDSGKTASLTILTETDISDMLPHNFTLKHKWKELTNLKLMVFNLTKSEIVKLAKKNKIQIGKIQNLEE